MIPLSKNNYIRTRGFGDNFKVEIDPVISADNYYNESVLAAEEIYSLKEGQMYVMYSGGIDSEYALSVFLELGMAITPVIIRLGNYNEHDIKYAMDFCHAKNITPKIINFDFDEFVKSEKILDVALESRSMLYHRPATAYVASQLDGTILLGDGEPYIRLNKNTNTWNLEIDEHDFAVCNYLVAKGIPCVPHFNRYRPGMMSSYMLDPRMQELAEHKHPGKLGSNSSKAYMYNRTSPFKLESRQKYTGYEIIEESEIFKHPVFAQMEDQCKKYNGLVAIDYHTFIKDYIQ
jgi:hypothetical protein